MENKKVSFYTMSKLVFISLLFLLIMGEVSGQVAHVSISANITNPVGAALFTDTETENNVMSNSTTDLKTQTTRKVKNIPSIKIIGYDFSHTVTVMDTKLSKNNNEEKNNSKQISHVTVMVSFD